VELRGLSLAPSQIWRGVRLVPILRDEPIEDLRLDPLCYGDELGVVSLPDRSTYTAFVPHAFVASWTSSGEPVAALGTQTSKGRAPRRGFPVRYHHRLAKRMRSQGTDTQRLRFLPLHTAFEAYLALHFRGPDVAWPEYSAAAMSEGLNPRIEAAIPGEWIDGLEDALRVFEILEGQVGVLIFVADALAAAFVVPHPDDYRRLHRTLLGDFYGELIWRYAGLYDQLPPTAAPIPAERVSSIADLERELACMRARWAEHQHKMASGLLHRNVHLEQVYRLGRHRLYRFLPEFSPDHENHIGELIRTPTGETAYLKTFRLSAAQVRRGYLLSMLARHDWSLSRTAEAMNSPIPELRRRLAAAGFVSLLKST
ncbi:MAG: hypothetical protein R6X02_23615, partial [Enhygromyxa sp.]